MGLERWKRIRELFDGAHSIAVESRSEFLRLQCGGDQDIRREVQRLLSLDEDAGSFLESPAFRILPRSGDTPNVLAPGALVGGRFRVGELLGRGGMGEVYQAHDCLLNVEVALKVMRPVSTGITDLSARFLSEARLARRIAHLGVCRVHDAVVHCLPDGSEVVAVIMELLRGETLAERIVRGPLNREEFLRLGEQLAEALDAAHAAGVLHRDIKPTNIFLVQRPDEVRCRAVLADFGLAQAIIERDSGMTSTTGWLVGTPEYLSPEQIRGESTSKASDIYCLALVLYEMASGDRPFSAKNFLGSAVKRLTEFPPSLARIGPHGVAWDRVFARALSPEPAQRYVAAGDLVTALVKAKRRHVTDLLALKRKRMLAAIAALAVLALFFWGFRLYIRGRPLVAPASHIVLTKTYNGTGDPSFDGASEVLRSQLAQSPRFEIVSSQRIQELLRQMRLAPATHYDDPRIARELALRDGAPLVTYSALTRLGPQYILNVRLEIVASRPAFTRSAWNRDFPANGKPEVFNAIHDAADWIRTMSGEQAQELSEQDRPTSDTTTSSWDALRLFAAANNKEMVGDTSSAVLLLKEALQLDPQFAMARMRLADIFIGLRRDGEGYEQWRQAIQITQAHELTARENLRVQAQYAEDTGDLVGAEQAYRAYALQYPNDFHSNFFVGSILSDLGRVSEAATWYEKAITLQPKGYTARVHLAMACLEAGDVNRTVTIASELRARGFEDWAAWLTSSVRFLRGNPVEAVAALEPVRFSTDPIWRSRSSAVRAEWLSEIGDYRQALDELVAGIAADERDGIRDREADKWLYIAEINSREGNLDSAEQSVARAMALAPNANRAMRGGTLLARAGRVRSARVLRGYLTQMPDVPRVRYALKALDGEIALAQGRVRDAVTLLRAAAAIAPVRISRLGLARALASSGNRNEAQEILEDALAHGSRLWGRPEPEYPGVWRDTVNEHTRLLSVLK